MFSYNVHYLLDFISEGKDCSMNKCFYSNLFYSLLTYGSTSDLILCTLSHHQSPELSQILRPPSLPTQTTTPCQTTSTSHSDHHPMPDHLHFPPTKIHCFAKIIPGHLSFSNSFKGLVFELCGPPQRSFSFCFFDVNPRPPQCFVYFEKLLGVGFLDYLGPPQRFSLFC